ncbi:MAG TPA: hypothetical protein VFR09_03500, partial [Alphaproteobacteria bacterium]|nr:hypothetical protein [Alphaproteobacteria bacterium]
SNGKPQPVLKADLSYCTYVDQLHYRAPIWASKVLKRTKVVSEKQRGIKTATMAELGKMVIATKVPDAVMQARFALQEAGRKETPTRPESFSHRAVAAANFN